MANLQEVKRQLGNILAETSKENHPIAVFYFFCYTLITVIEEKIAEDTFSEVKYIQHSLADSFIPWLGNQNEMVNNSSLKSVIFNLQDKSLFTTYYAATSAYMQIDFCAFLANFPIEESEEFSNHADIIEIINIIDQVNQYTQQLIDAGSPIFYQLINSCISGKHKIWLDIHQMIPEIELHADMIRGIEPGQQRKILNAMDNAETPHIKTMVENAKPCFKILNALFPIFHWKSIHKTIEGWLSTDKIIR